MALKVGDKAPDFKLFSSDKAAVSLQDFAGKNVIIQFFPAAFTSVCTDQLCEMRDSLKRFEKLNADVLGISVDSPFTLAKFKTEQGLNFPLLSDFNKTTVHAYGLYRKDFVLGMEGVSERASLLIDKNGVIRHIEVLENPGNLPNFAALNAALTVL